MLTFALLSTAFATLLVHNLLDTNYNAIVADRSGNSNFAQKTAPGGTETVFTPYGLYLRYDFLKLPNNLYDSVFPYTTTFTMTIYFRLLSSTNPTETIYFFNTGFSHGVHLYRSDGGSTSAPFNLMLTSGSDYTDTTPTSFEESKC
jgi:hypothetical protein